MGQNRFIRGTKYDNANFNISGEKGARIIPVVSKRYLEVIAGLVVGISTYGFEYVRFCLEIGYF